MSSDFPLLAELRGRRVLVTGASGFVGRRLVPRLCGLAASITAWSRSGQGFPAGVEGHAVDLTDAAAVHDAVHATRPEIVLHLAAHVTARQDRGLVPEMLSTTLGGTVHLLTALSELKTCRRVVVASSAEVPASSATAPTSPYAAAKASADLFSRMFHRVFQVPIVILRPTMLYGPGQATDKFLPQAIRALRQGQPPQVQSPGRTCDLLFVDDFVQALLHAACLPHLEGETLALGSGRVSTLGQVVDRLAALLGCRDLVPTQAVPGSRSGEQSLIIDNRRARQLLRWQPTWSLEQGLQATIAAYPGETATAQPNLGVTTVNRADQLRAQILELVEQYHAEAFAPRDFVAGTSAVPVSGRKFDATEIRNLVDSSLDFWLTTGRYAERFERQFADRLQVKHALLCNSGSSANLLAVSALTSESLGERRLRPGDEIITAAAGFPTTVNPILQNGLIPVFVDVELETYNVDVEQLAAAIGPKTRGIMLAHTLGNPFNLAAVTELARQHDLWLIEDNCDAVGSLYDGRPTGSFGDLATVSFYPAHHITMGEGGCVLTGDGRLKMLVESFRDWGRACWCAPGVDNTCNKRFGWKLGDMPCGYDHKYTYSHIGYNLKLTDMQAAVGVAQLEKLESFTAQRRTNWATLRAHLAPYESQLILPRATERSEPSWFGFPITVREDAGFSRLELVQYLESRRIATRLLFGGNLTRQPAYQHAPRRIAGSLANTDRIMHQTFWIGVYPGLNSAMLDYVGETFGQFLRDARNHAWRAAS